MGHRRLSVREQAVLQDIVKRSMDLPLELSEYRTELAAIRRQLGVLGRVRGEITKGYARTHQVRARAPWRQSQAS